MAKKGCFATVAFLFFTTVTITLSVESLLRCECNTKDSDPSGDSNQATIHKGKPDTRSPCATWYTVHQGETQWEIAEQFAPAGRNKQDWLKSMRWMSHKSQEDQHVRPNETVCVKW